jgi:hypothetical protein
MLKTNSVTIILFREVGAKKPGMLWGDPRHARFLLLYAEDPD